MTAELNIVGVSRLDDHLLLADAGLAMAMVGAGAERLVDLRGETKPPGLPIPIDHFPLIDLEPDQDEVILAAGRHVAGLAAEGVTVGLYCQAGISRTSAVAIAYLLVRGVPLDEANRAVREARPQAMPALELWRSLERIAASLALSRPRSPATAKRRLTGTLYPYSSGLRRTAGDPHVTEATSADLEPSTPPSPPVPARQRTWYAVCRQLPLLILPVAWGVLGWRQRWIADDGLIEARVVRQILAGNGPVFNPGERVEANTSALWTWLLAAATWASRLDLYTVIIGSGLLLAPLGLLFALLGARELHRRHAPGQVLLPAGALVVVALPPFWDFVTSGLEDSLIFCWLGLCWWLLAGLRPDSRRRSSLLAFIAGLGWLVRPDMAIGTVGFLAALWYITRPAWRRAAVLATVAAAVPLAYQVFRMGYYGLLVPNTAVAKEASHVRFHQGFVYLADFASPYHLWIALAVLLVLFLLTSGHLNRADAVRCAAAAGSGLLMALYVIAIGGDFMHARMLLPPTFALLLPVMLVPVPVPRLRAGLTQVSLCLLAATMGVWAVGAGLRWRDPTPIGIIPASGIANERGFWTVHTGQRNPDNAADYVLTGMGSANATGSLEWQVSRDARSGRAVLLYQVTQWSPFVSVPLSRPRYPVAVTAYILGTWGGGTPLDGLVVDMHGLSYALGSHLVGDPNGRPGHSKWVNPAWVVAEYSDVTQAPGIPAAQLAAARKALSCGPLAELDQATQAPMTAGRFVSNFVHSLTLTTFRISPDPVTAERELCG